MKDIVIVGAGGLGLETAWLIEENNKINKRFNLLGYYDDDPNSKLESKMWIEYLGTIAELEKATRKIDVVIAIAKPEIKKILFDKLSKNNFITFPNVICEKINIHNTNTIGFGNIIFSDAKITVNIDIGNFNLIGFNVTVGHGTNIGNYNSIYPGATISGDVSINNYVEIGTGANIIQDKRIDSYTKVGAGSVVIRDCGNNCTLVGVPGEVVKKGNDEAN